ncbi:hypothetical protein BDA99DRAFT_493387 [Phascolomyces articulosus]|uniref:Zn(2)-C6 fungal-type domain-containing protein n=1 Tax=Phascolomyces articulosus TaxID=60185 RepID=A0AAD5PKX3_9FUNG|nr:hypothetical protein BDA99DRAFT_493387 [Phascolomyces articulosus]
MPPRSSNAPVSKKIRMTLACERCRTKKVKCDFAHPSCLRCQQANATCSYAGSSTQLDLFNLIQVNEAVDLLQKRVRSLESDLQQMRDKEKQTELRGKSDQHHRWALSLTNQGLRIDTNIISMHDLHHLFNANPSIPPTPTSSCDDMIVVEAKLWKSEYKTFPLYSTWEDHSSTSPSHSIQRIDYINHNNNNGDENHIIHQLHPTIQHHTSSSHQHHQHRHSSFSSSSSSSSSSLSLLDFEDTSSISSSSYHQVPKFTLDRLIGVYQECFICLNEPWHDNTLSHRYFNNDLDPLLTNVVFAWSARHGAIYHGLFPGQDPNLVGEPFFIKAKELLKERFTTSNIDTVHALLVMHNYVMGKTGNHRKQAESEAYMYLGLAIRMSLDLQMHQEVENVHNPIEKERNRRFFWLAYFLETLCTLNIGKPMSIQENAYNNSTLVGFPGPLNHEIGPIRWRVEFMSQRYRIIRIYRRLMELTTAAKEKQPLALRTITALDKQVKDWYAALENHFRYDPHDPKWKTSNSATWMRDMGCLKLNVEYHYTMMQLYSLFLSSPSPSSPTPSSPSSATSTSSRGAMQMLARQISRSSADKIVDLVECWSASLPKEAWCHFALEPVMVTIRLYTQLIEEDDEDALILKTRMERIATILENSPIQQRHPVKTILDTIYTSTGGPNNHSHGTSSDGTSTTHLHPPQHQHHSIPQTIPLLVHWSSNSMPVLSSDILQQQNHHHHQQQQVSPHHVL